MANIFSIIWLNLRNLAKRKQDNPDDKNLSESFSRTLEIAKHSEPKSYEEFKDS
ncbi:hypothetical protein [Enterovibrio norvegicus]|uniref:hypothetical protein n=1 Tax=Enterovibrio norvegicus TaxID=188144 RepID=UPI0012FFFDB5|nr:hypothetical protein [Enterovibrio norvegicus]